MGIIHDYFPGIDPVADRQFRRLQELYTFWNEKINVISRRDLSNLYINHILHSLSLARVINFQSGEVALDIGTGGGFPGIPLAILNPDVRFTLIDARGKKIRVVENIVKDLSLANISPVHARAEDYRGTCNYIFSRAVASFSDLVELSAGKIEPGKGVRKDHGLYSLKGGDLSGELAAWEDRVKIYDIADFFKEDYFRTKKIVFLPARKMPG